MPSDIEIAQACEMEPIVEVAAQAGIDEKYPSPFHGKYMAKVDNISVLKDYADKPDGKLILVTAITPTPAGEGQDHVCGPGRWHAPDRRGRDRRVARAPPWGRLRHQGRSCWRRLCPGRADGGHQSAFYRRFSRDWRGEQPAGCHA